jgi:hypothetical protein
MGFLQNLFGKKDNSQKIEEKVNNHIEISPEKFLVEDFIVELVNKYKRPTTLLRPQRSGSPIGQEESKFGGVPNFGGFNKYPVCNSCNTPLNFVLQLYKKDFPDFYFPDSSNLFQLFRCPNTDCPDAFSDKYDMKTFHYYFNITDSNKILTKPESEIADLESEVPDCILRPQVANDFPVYDDFEADDFNEIEVRYGNDMSELFMETYFAIPNTKLGGYPSYTQSPSCPDCSICGKTKEFYFQLASEDREDDGNGYPGQNKEWSAHGIMIGDVGNIYYFVCKSCGAHTIESTWDCY